MKSINTLKIGLVGFVLMLCSLPKAQATDYTIVTDTVVLEFGNNSKILILVESKEDLNALRNYDINQMLEDLAVSIEESEENVDYLTIEDNQGDRYLRDTTIVVRNPNSNRDEIQVKNGVRVKVANYEISTSNLDSLDEDFEDFQFSDLKKSEHIEKNSYGTRHSFNLEWGLTNWLENGKFPDANNAQHTVKPWASWYLGLSSTQKTSLGGVFFLEWGGHFNWFNWKFEDRNTRISKEDTEVVFSADNSVNGKKSKLSATYLNVHLVPMLDFSYGKRRVKTYEKGSFKVTKYKKRGFRMGAGGYAGYRLGSHSRVVYKEDGDREKEKEGSNFFMNNFRYGIRGQMGYKGFDFFVNYDLNEVFSENRGPSLNAISFGIII